MGLLGVRLDRVRLGRELDPEDDFLLFDVVVGIREPFYHEGCWLAILFFAVI